MFNIDNAFLFDWYRETYKKLFYNKKTGKLLIYPLRYIIDLTYKCSLSCPHCYIDKRYTAKNELSAKELKNIIKQIPRYGLISLIGGEPFIRDDFFEILEFASKHTFGKVNTYSNGTLLNKDIIQKLFTIKLLLFAISIDGIQQTHDINRNCNGLFDKILSILDVIKQIKTDKNMKFPLCEINTVVLENNLDDLPKLYKLAAQYKFEYIGFLFKRTNYRQNPKYFNNLNYKDLEKKLDYEIYFDIEHFNEIYNELNSLKKRYSTKIRWSPRFNNIDEINYIFSNLNEDINTLFKPCSMPFHDIFINPQGIVYPCVPLNMGTLKEQKLKDIINNEKFCNFRKTLYKEKLFGNCLMCCDIHPQKICI